MGQVQDPLYKRDYKVTEGFDFVIRTSSGGSDIPVIGGIQDPIIVIDQIIRLALKTNKGSYVYDQFFGASPVGIKTHMTADGVSRLRLFILENLRLSSINPNNYPFDVSIIPIGPETVSIQVQMFIFLDKGMEPVRVNSVFDYSTQILQTVRAFGE